ncbi:MAG TPA: gephyrin-like molybdotransferase Glp [Chitinophagaceae bacterium]
MISVAEAKKIILENVSSLAPVTLPIQVSAGLILADDVYATMDIPAFPQSSMDGYAFSFEGWRQYKNLKITGEVAAGSNETFSLTPGNAVRIFTGAAVPPGADTVIMQEKTRVENGNLKIEDESLTAGTSVRLKGSEIKSGELALKKGDLLMPAAIGFLAGIGINEVKAFPNPSITIIITGNELLEPGQPLQHGQVYESNSFALKAALKQLQMENVQILYVKDRQEELTNTLESALQQTDIILLTGGISVGDYDFVLQSATECEVEKLFHKVKQRPGKPLYFGKKENKLVFGLPGNPSSVLTCFYQYVIPALEKLSKRQIGMKVIKVPLAKAFQKNAGLTHFLKGFYDGKTALPLEAQESFRLSSFAKANGLIQIDEETISLKEGELVDVYLLPQ